MYTEFLELAQLIIVVSVNTATVILVAYALLMLGEEVTK